MQLAAALQAARVFDGVVISHAGPLSHPDIAAEMADLLLRLERARWVICMGVHKEERLLSVRTRTRRGGAGALAQKIVERRGSAGEHGTMAGEQIPLKGENAEQMARQLGQRVLEYRRVTAGKPLI